MKNSLSVLYTRPNLFHKFHTILSSLGTKIANNDFKLKEITAELVNYDSVNSDNYFLQKGEIGKFLFENRYCKYSHFGNVLYSEEVSSTQLILEREFQNLDENLIYLASSQTSGKGRTSNNWKSPEGNLYCIHDIMSPVGCLMFSFNSFVKRDINLNLFQYIAALAMMKSISSFIPEVAVKWPNDIYIDNNKIGGIICNSVKFKNPFAPINMAHNSKMKIVYGIGVNFSNKEPTRCLRDYNPRIELAELMNKFMSEFSYYNYILENDGFWKIKKEFEACWMHK
jgi:biotin-[acetyl-CoA-carboxylase] ligase BirA-like protein